MCLQRLNLRGNKAGDRGAAAIGTALEQGWGVNLEAVNLAHNEIGEATYLTLYLTPRSLHTVSDIYLTRI